MTTRLDLSREQILAHRRRVSALDERLPDGADSLRAAAWAGLTDSMPRAAIVSAHARVEGVTADVLDDPSLVQLWGPRFCAYAVAEQDRAVFTRGRLADDGPKRRRGEELAARLAELLGDEARDYGEAGRALGVNPNELRYAAPTGTVVMRWDGATRPTIRSVPAPDVEPADARAELARRCLHVSGPATAESFGKWAGIRDPRARAAFDALEDELTPVRTPIGEAWILTSDEASFREPAGPPAPARLLPSGDTYYLLWGADRELLVADPDRRDDLWTSRVWPGAVLVDGEIVGIWRRQQHKVTVETWEELPVGARQAVEAEAASLPLPGIDREVVVRWGA
jgi:hypothetical protein